MKRFFPLALLLVLFATGCGRGGFGAAMFATGLIIGAASHSHHHHHPRPVVVVAAPEPSPTPAVIVVREASPRDTPPPPRGPSFDTGAARNALKSADLAPCRAEGAPRTHGHAKVTFRPDGTIEKVTIDQPSGLSVPAVSCIGRELGRARVPAFEGTNVDVGTSFFVP